MNTQKPGKLKRVKIESGSSRFKMEEINILEFTDGKNQTLVTPEELRLMNHSQMHNPSAYAS